MKITVKIMNKEDGLGWSKPIDIEDFIVYPYDIELSGQTALFYLIKILFFIGEIIITEFL